MSAYSLDLAEKFAHMAGNVLESESDQVTAKRAALYLGRLSMELTMKACLEAAGMPVSAIKQRWHDLIKLSNALAKCEVFDHSLTDTGMWRRASTFLALPSSHSVGMPTVGDVLHAEDADASVYPNEIRYGADEQIADFPPEIIVGAAQRLVGWARQHIRTIRLAP